MHEMLYPLPANLSLGSKVITDSRANLCVPERSERHTAATIREIRIAPGKLYITAREKSRIFSEVTYKRTMHRLGR